MRILVINADALHVGYLGCYGCEWAPTPNLDRLAADGVVFDRHYADCPQPPDPAGAVRRSAWTGRLRSPLASDKAVSPPVSPLPDLLKQSNIATQTIALSDWDPRRLGRALATLAGKEPALVWLELPSLLPPWTVAPEQLEAFAQDGDAEEVLTPWLDPGIGPLPLNDQALERLQMTYAAVICQFDDWLGALLGTLEDRKLYDDLLLIMTADSGLALGEHGAVGPHRAWMHEEVWHVPLVLRLPQAGSPWPGIRRQEAGVGSQDFAGRRIAVLTQPVDLFPTIGESFGLALRASGNAREHGLSLWPLLCDETTQLRPYACGGLQVGGSIECALRTPDWAFLLPLQVPEGDPPRSPRLYVKPDDRWEANDVRQQHMDLAEELEKTLRERCDHPS